MNLSFDWQKIKFFAYTPCVFWKLLNQLVSAVSRTVIHIDCFSHFKKSSSLLFITFITIWAFLAMHGGCKLENAIMAFSQLYLLWKLSKECEMMAFNAQAPETTRKTEAAVWMRLSWALLRMPDVLGFWVLCCRCLFSVVILLIWWYDLSVGIYWTTGGADYFVDITKDCVWYTDTHIYKHNVYHPNIFCRMNCS